MFQVSLGEPETTVCGVGAAGKFADEGAREFNVLQRLRGFKKLRLHTDAEGCQRGTVACLSPGFRVPRADRVGLGHEQEKWKHS